MSTRLEHSVARIVQTILYANRGLGTDPLWWATHRRPADAAGIAAHPWPVFRNAEPDEPDNCITVYRAQPIPHVRIQVTGEMQQHRAVTVRVRGRDDETAEVRAEAIAHDLNERAFDNVVTLDLTRYLVPSFTALVGPVVAVTPVSALRFVNVNVTFPVLAYPIQG